MRRRNLLAGLGALVIAVAGGTAWKLRPQRKHYAPTPYDDLLNRLDDREAAAKFGVSALAALPEFTPQTGAAKLRARLGKNSLQKAALADAAAGRLVEVNGWLVPECVVLMAALAKSVS
jgi:hypothetical protein